MFLLVAPQPAAAAASPPPDPPRLDEIVSWIEEGEYEAARTVLQRLALGPHPPAVDYLLGVALLEGGRAHDAAPWLERALAARADRARWAHTLGRCRAELGRYAAALDAFGAALRLEERSDWRFDRARSALALGDLDLAERELRAVLAGQPEFHPARFELAAVLQDRGRPGEARPLLERLVADAAAHVDGWFRLGQVALELDDPAGARAAFERAAALAPGHAGASYQLALLLEQAGEQERGAALRAIYRVALAREELIENRRARVALEPGDRAARDELVGLLLLAGRLAEARSELERWVRLAADDAAAWERLAEVAARQGDGSRAGAAAERASRLREAPR